MVRSAHGYSIVFLFISPFMVLSGCKRLDKKNPVQVIIKAHIPYDNTPIPNVKYTIKEYKSKQDGGLGDVEYTDFILEGVTDENGIANISFYRKKNQKYYYDIAFDYSNINVPFAEYSLVNAPYGDHLSKSDPNENNYEIIVLPLGYMHFKVENIACYDTNDKMRFKTYNLDERPFDDFQYIPWGDYFDGCGLHVDFTGSNKILSGRHLYQIEVTRNNIVTTYIDTFFLEPNVTNDVFLEY